MALLENKESWETLQKGQIAELAFERIALAHGFGVRYAGQQYTDLILPSHYRTAPIDRKKWTSDFELWKHTKAKWKLFARVEVKWRSKQSEAPTTLPSDADYFVLFTPSQLLCAPAKDYKKPSQLKPIECCKKLKLVKKQYEEIRNASESLIRLWPNV